MSPDFCVAWGRGNDFELVPMCAGGQGTHVSREEPLPHCIPELWAVQGPHRPCTCCSPIGAHGFLWGSPNREFQASSDLMAEAQRLTASAGMGSGLCCRQSLGPHHGKTLTRYATPYTAVPMLGPSAVPCMGAPAPEESPAPQHMEQNWTGVQGSSPKPEASLQAQPPVRHQPLGLSLPSQPQSPRSCRATQRGAQPPRSIVLQLSCPEPPQENPLP